MARSSSSLLLRDRYGRFKKSPKNRSKSKSKSKSRSKSRRYTKKRRSEAAKKAWRTRRRRLSKSKSSTRSKSSSRSRPYTKKRRSEAAKKAWRTRRRNMSKSKSKSKGRKKSKKSTRSRSRSRLTAKEEKTLARRLGITVAQLRSWTKAASRRRLSESISKREKKRRAAYRRRREQKRRAEMSDSSVVSSFEESSVSFGPALSPTMATDEIVYLKRAQKNLRAKCSALLSYDPRTGESEFDQDEVLQETKDLLRDLESKYPDIRQGLRSETTVGALRENCELLQSRIKRYLSEIGRDQSFSVASVSAEEVPVLMSSSGDLMQFPSSPPSSAGSSFEF